MKTVLAGVAIALRPARSTPEASRPFALYDRTVRFRVVAFHFPKPEYQAEMVERIKRAAEVMAGCPGFIAADCWLETEGDAVVAIGTFESKEQWLQAMRVVARADVDFDFDEREREPRRVQLLLEA
jgi:methionine synthase II (cobalamin-independent)